MSKYHRMLSQSRWTRARALVLAAAAGLCEIRTDGVCTRRATCVDHIIPLSRGGHPYDTQNLRAACRGCNQHAMTPTTPKVANPWKV